jgi:hypothetical protein
MAKAKEVAVKDNGGVPAYLKGYTGPMGTEGIENDDISIPMIKIGQGTSLEVKSGEVAEGDFFLNITGEVLGNAESPMRAVIIASTKEYILWRDRKYEGGGIMARAKKGKVDGKTVYLWDKPNQTFVNKVDGKHKVEWTTGEYLVADEGLDAWGSEIPGNEDSGKAATAHHNFLVILPDHGNMVAALSLSRSQVRKAEDLNGILTMKGSAGLPLFVNLFEFTTIDVTNKEGQQYKNYKFRPAGLIPDEWFATYEATFKRFTSTGWEVEQSQDAGEAALQGGF